MILIKKRNIIVKLIFRFEGIAEFTYKAVSSGIDRVVLDTDALHVIYVTDNSNKALIWYFDNDNQSPALIILLKHPLSIDSTTTIRIYYQTSQEKTNIGIQWLTPAMTFGKKYPFVYTQGEAIFARSIFPVQDTPAVKFTVKTALTVAKPFVAIFGGVKVTCIENGDMITYIYEQIIPIQSFLVAIAAGGELEYRSYGKRTGVWAEKAIIEKAYYEFVDAEKLIATVII